MAQMYVKPMNRPVRFFIEVNADTIKEGNIDMEVIKEKKYTPYYIGGTIGVLILIGGAYILKRNKKNSNNIEE